jgi:hypothetical protein
MYEKLLRKVHETKDGISAEKTPFPINLRAGMVSWARYVTTGIPAAASWPT